MAGIVIQRVLELSKSSDYYAMLQLYGGKEKVGQLIKEKVNFLSPREMNFACLIFNLKKEELKCYKRILSRKQLLNF